MEISQKEFKEMIQLAAKTALEQYKVETGRLFTIDETADMLNVSRSTIYNKMRAGEIQSVDVWGQKKFSLPAIQACRKPMPVRNQ